MNSLEKEFQNLKKLIQTQLKNKYFPKIFSKNVCCFATNFVTKFISVRKILFLLNLKREPLFLTKHE